MAGGVGTGRGLVGIAGSVFMGARSSDSVKGLLRWYFLTLCSWGEGKRRASKKVREVGKRRKKKRERRVLVIIQQNKRAK